MKKVAVLLLLAVGVFCFSGKETRRTALYHRTDVPEGSEWEHLKVAEIDQQVTFSLGLKQQNLDILEQWFWDNSNPRSSNFAKHKTRDEIMNLIAPSEEDQEKVLNWLAENSKELGVDIAVNNMKDRIEVTAPVQFVNHLFQTEMNAFVSRVNNKVVFKHLGELSMPHDVASVVDLVTGITELPPTKERKAIRKQDSDPCLVPFNLKKLYSVDLDLAIDTDSLVNGIYSQWEGSGKEGYGEDDVASFQKANSLPAAPVKDIRGDASDKYSKKDTDGEANLDVQMVTGMAPGANIVFYVMDENWMYEFTSYVFNNPNPPTVISISYGWDEKQQCQTDDTPFLANCTTLEIPDSETYVNKTNVEFQKLGLMGISIFVSSGDDGAVGDLGCKISPEFPGCSPYVTSVGGTAIVESGNKTTDFGQDPLPSVCTDRQYQCDCTDSANEQPALIDTAEYDTGGGFSNFSPMPDYQKNAVQSYLNSGVKLPPSGWNRNGRGFPDVAAMGSGVCVFDAKDQGHYFCDLVGGTSASAPIWAGLAALLNQDRIKAGKAPLGFMNQVLYDMFDQSPTQYFNNDFAKGENDNGCSKNQGFHANSGSWTPLTGLGSPKFDQIRKYISALP